MDANEARAATIKQTRRKILAALLIMYEIGPLSFEAICQALLFLELPDDACVKKDLTYLCEKRYVRWTNKKDYLPWSQRMFSLTAAGNEVANRITDDPALQP